jgi:hypothetical protein
VSSELKLKAVRASKFVGAEAEFHGDRKNATAAESELYRLDGHQNGSAAQPATAPLVTAREPLFGVAGTIQVQNVYQMSQKLVLWHPFLRL